MKTLLMKQLTLILIGTLCTFTLFAQDKSERASPPAEASGKIGDATITINYSSPKVKGRVIWGELVPYDEVWRAGANEATTFETDKDLTIEGSVLPAGKYSFFTIPTTGDWTIIFNKVPDQWGAYSYNPDEDALRVTVTPTPSDEMNEDLVYEITEDGVSLKWENLEIPISIE